MVKMTMLTIEAVCSLPPDPSRTIVRLRRSRDINTQHKNEHVTIKKGKYCLDSHLPFVVPRPELNTAAICCHTVNSSCKTRVGFFVFVTSFLLRSCCSGWAINSNVLLPRLV